MHCSLLPHLNCSLPLPQSVLGCNSILFHQRPQPPTPNLPPHPYPPHTCPIPRAHKGSPCWSCWCSTSGALVRPPGLAGRVGHSTGSQRHAISREQQGAPLCDARRIPYPNTVGAPQVGQRAHSTAMRMRPGTRSRDLRATHAERDRQGVKAATRRNFPWRNRLHFNAYNVRTNATIVL